MLAGQGGVRRRRTRGRREPLNGFADSIVEDAARAWLESLGHTVLHGPDIAAGELSAERADANFCDVVLEWRLRHSLARLSPQLPPEGGRLPQADPGSRAIPDRPLGCCRTEEP
jgi:hypothetical protein